MFLISFAVSLLTFKGWAGLGPENTVGLFVVVYLFSALFVTVYVVMQLILVLGTLQERWPLLHIFFGVLAFVLGQILLYTFSETICDNVEHYMDGLFFATLMNLLAVMMVYKVRDRCLLSYWALADFRCSTGIPSLKKTWNSLLDRRPTTGKSKNFYQRRTSEIPCMKTATTRAARITSRTNELLRMADNNGEDTERRLRLGLIPRMTFSERFQGTIHVPMRANLQFNTQLYQDPSSSKIIYQAKTFYLHNLHPCQIVNNHIPTHPNPSPPEPAHLALMRRRHSPLRPPHISRSTHGKQRCRERATFLPAPDTCKNGANGVHNARVFSQDICRCERVKLNRTFPPGMPLHNVFEESVRAVEERNVVWMA